MKLLKCPKCGEYMIYRNGRYGKYLSCPKCGEALGPLSELEARPCPLCSGWRWKNEAACGTCRENTRRHFRWLMKAGFGRTEMEVIDQLLEGNSLMDVIGEDKKEEKEKC